MTDTTRVLRLLRAEAVKYSAIHAMAEAVRRKYPDVARAYDEKIAYEAQFFGRLPQWREDKVLVRYWYTHGAGYLPEEALVLGIRPSLRDRLRQPQSSTPPTRSPEEVQSLFKLARQIARETEPPKPPSGQDLARRAVENARRRYRALVGTPGE